MNAWTKMHLKCYCELCLICRQLSVQSLIAGAFVGKCDVSSLAFSATFVIDRRLTMPIVASVSKTDSSVNDLILAIRRKFKVNAMENQK